MWLGGFFHQTTGTSAFASQKIIAKGALATKHPGFAVAARRIARKQGISMERARAILAAGARGASPAAKRRNPRLKKVKG